MYKSFIFLIASLTLVQATHAQDSLKETGKVNRESASIIVEKKQYTHEDTINAVHHLFKRKKVGGIVRAVLFAGLVVPTVAMIINYQPNTVTVNNGPYGSQTISANDTPPVGIFFAAGMEVAASIDGIRQASSYSTRRWKSTLDRLKKGRHPSRRIKSKLKEKDFSVN